MLINHSWKKKLPSRQQVDCCLTPQLDNSLVSRHIKLATKIRGFAFIFFRGKDSRNHDWHIISSARFEYQWKDACMHAQSLSHVWLFVTLWTVAHQALLSMGFSQQEYWNRLPFPPPVDLPEPGIESASPVLADRFFNTVPPGKPKGKMNEPQTKEVYEKFCGLWTQAELLCNSEKCDLELGREASWPPLWETQQGPCPSKWSAWKCKEMNPLACILTLSLTAPVSMAIKR